MKNLIRKWLDLPTREELYERIDKQVISKTARQYDKLRKSDKQRYRQILSELTQPNNPNPHESK